MVSGNYGIGKSDNNSNTQITPIGSTIWDSELIADNFNRSDRDNINANINYQFSDTTGHSFTMDLDYGVYAIGNHSDQYNTYRYNSDTSPSQLNYFNTTQVDICLLYPSDAADDLTPVAIDASLRPYKYLNYINSLMLHTNRD